MSADSAENDDQGMSQAEIDAAFGGVTEAASPPSPSAEKSDSPADSAESSERRSASDGLSQADIDAALGAASEAASPPADPSTAAPESSTPVTDSPSAAQAFSASGGLSQAEIDAAFGEPAPESSASTPASDDASPVTEAQDGPTDSEGRPFDAAAAAMAEAIAEEKAAAAAAASAAPPVETTPFELPDFGSELADAEGGQGIELLRDVNLRVTVELGRTRMAVEDVLKLGDGSIVELDKLAGDPVDVMVNGRLVARGEVLVLNDTFSVRISEIVSAREQALASA